MDHPRSKRKGQVPRRKAADGRRQLEIPWALVDAIAAGKAAPMRLGSALRLGSFLWSLASACDPSKGRPVAKAAPSEIRRAGISRRTWAYRAGMMADVVTDALAGASMAPAVRLVNVGGDACALAAAVRLRTDGRAVAMAKVGGASLAEVAAILAGLSTPEAGADAMLAVLVASCPRQDRRARNPTGREMFARLGATRRNGALARALSALMDAGIVTQSPRDGRLRVQEAVLHRMADALPKEADMDDERRRIEVRAKADCQAYLAGVDRELGRRSAAGVRADRMALTAEHQAWIDPRFGPDDPRRYPADALTGRILVGRFLDGWAHNRRDEAGKLAAYAGSFSVGHAVRLAEERLKDAREADAILGGDDHVRQLVHTMLWASHPDVFVPGRRTPERVLGEGWDDVVYGIDEHMQRLRRRKDAQEWSSRRRAEQSKALARHRGW